MKTIELSKWSDFKGSLQSIREEHGYLRHEDEVIREHDILYRGHGNSDWKLLTTLERFSNEHWNVDKYCRAITRCAPQIESFTGTKWDLPTYPEIQKELKDNFDKVRVHLPAYTYWVYLRHHGFPSPLLDWTKSPYIAAFFAFSQHTASDNVAIFAYIERPEGVKGGSIGDPIINVKGPYVSTHKRHFLQQAIYTTCARYDYAEEKHSFVEHENVFSKNDQRQDMLIKITMPSSEKNIAFKELNLYNINYFSLYQTEDALVKHLAFTELEKENL
jgi:hypothetical protein